MKKLVIIFFLFLGGVCCIDTTNDVYAANARSRVSIYFTDTYNYIPEKETGNLIGNTSTNNPSRNRNQKLPKSGESINGIFVPVGGALVLLSTLLIKNYRKKELQNENS